MGRSTQLVSTTCRSEFDVFDSATPPVAVTGLTNSDFTKILSKNGANDATTVTVTEVANGRYTVTVAPASAGYWRVRVYNSTYFPFSWSEDYDVVAALANTTTPPTVAAIRTEMDSNSTKLANLDATTSSRLASASYTAPPSVSDIATAVWAYVTYSGWSVLKVIRKIFALTAGKTVGGPTGTTAYAPDGTTAEVVGTADSNGDRTITSYES